MPKIEVTTSYPYSEEYEYETRLEKIDLEEEREEDLKNDNGFVVWPPNGIKKDLKDPNGIFSYKFGQTLKDLTPYANRYRCNCGYKQSRLNKGSLCQICGSRVRRVDDNFGYFGWLVLKDPHYIIHPNLFKSLEGFIGKDELDDIIYYKEDIDADGHIVKDLERKKKERKTTDKTKKKVGSYSKIGILKFKENFDEIMEYFRKQSSNQSKKDYYNDIMENKEKIFIQSIPVFTTLLRPVDADQKTFFYEDSNSFYNVMNSLVSRLNKYDELGINKKKQSNLTMLYTLQIKYNKLYKNLEDILDKKKGLVRSLLGGRYNFSSRCVITPDPSLRIDQITLPYKCLVELLQQRIVNVIQKTYNKSYSDAYSIWYKANIEEDPMVKNIIQTIIDSSGNGRGIPVIINRNPTIAYGGILQMFCVKMTSNYTMGIPLQILKLLGADFDGDVLNIMMIINDKFFERAYQVFNPRNAMYISRNDGKFNNDVNHQRDTIINANTIINLSRSKYTKEELDNINRIKSLKQ